ncbi:MAG: bifunctional lysylphosphatidylglycerol flippase/synthetase MprF [Leifsonia sp.]|uniref:bifunctional lysylphosphatidylglycerol flippase/synthetase MprF n=1 Tax=Leifsonia sp. TaxID=1870902 RepID=UPI003F7FFCBC
MTDPATSTADDPAAEGRAEGAPAPAPERTPRRAPAWLGRTGRLVARHPFTTGITLLVLVLALATGPLHGPHRPLRGWLGTGADQLAAGHWWSPVTAVLFTDNLGELLVALALTVVLVGAAERLMGTWRTALAFFGTAVAGIAVGAGLQLLGSHAGEMWARNVHHLVVLDVFTALGGTIMAASAFAGTLWRRRIRVVTLLVAIMYVLYSGLPSDLYRLLAVLAGLGLGVLLRPSKRIAGWRRSSHHEVRVLLASAVTISALGPVIGLLSKSRYGMLSPIGLLFTSGVPDKGSVLERCQAWAVTRDCVQDLTLVRINGLGPVLLSVLPLLVLLVAAYGLLRGRRFAVWLGVAVNGLLAVLSALYFGILPLANAHPDFSPRYWEVTAILSLSSLVPLTMAVLLIVYRRHFTVLPSARAVRRYVLTVVLTGIGLVVAYVLIGWLQKDTGFTRPIELSDLFDDVLERFVPVSFLRREPVQYLPTTPLATFVYHNIGTVFWLVVIVAAIPLMLGSGSWRRTSGDSARARALLERGGGDAISFMATWPGNSYWFDPVDGRGIAYRVVGRVALTTGGPFGGPPPHDAAIEHFAQFCDDHGWIPVFYSVESTYEPLFHRMGWSTMTVAEETVIRPQQWATTGKKWQDVRSSINRAQRAGIRSEWTTYAALPLSAAVQLSDISEQWVAEKDLPEMGFTLGGLDELRDPAVRLMLAVDENGRIEGVTSWLPSYREGIVIGWTLDFMRRRPGSINGVMEFLIAEAATRMKEDGVEFMSLSAAPLAHTAGAGDGDPSGMDRILGYLSSSLEPVYGFRSLLKFKQKFQPELHPVIMAYPDPVALPTIGVALVRAYLPDLSVAQAASLAVGRG